MSIRKVALVELTNGRWSSGVYSRRSCLEPYALECLAAPLAAEGFEVAVCQERSEGYRGIMETLCDLNPDVAAFTTYTYNVPSVIQACRGLKERRSDVVTICGGYHATAHPELASLPEIDIVVRGEGDLALTQALQNLNEGKRPSECSGVCDKTNCLSAPDVQPCRILDLDGLPRPLRFKHYLETSRMYCIMDPPPAAQSGVAVVSYSRGCPYDCTYCSNRRTFGSLVTHRSPESLCDEIGGLIRDFGTNTVMFTDTTFNLEPDRVAALCNEIRRRRLQFSWSCSCRADRSSDLYQLMHSAGCTQIGFGVERIDREPLTSLKPNLATNIEETKAAIRVASDVGILVRGFIIIGLPSDSRESLMSFADDLTDWPLDDLRVGFLTPFAETRIADQLKAMGIKASDDLTRYTTDDPVLSLPKITNEDLLECRREIVRRHFTSKAYAARAKSKIRKIPRLQPAYDEFFAYMRAKGII